jgi:hypothetical protein
VKAATCGFDPQNSRASQRTEQNSGIRGGRSGTEIGARKVRIPIAETGWGARIRTWEWRNQNPAKFLNDSSMYSEIWDCFPTFAALKSQGNSEFQNGSFD